MQANRAAPTTFSFETDEPDRDVFQFGVVVVVPNGVQTFVNIECLVGQRFVENYVGSVGLRLEM